MEALSKVPREVFDHGRVLFAGAAVALVPALIVDGRRSTWFALAPTGLLTAAYLATLTLFQNRPSRYFLPLVALACIVLGLGVGVLLARRRWHLGLPLLCVALLAVSLNGWQSLKYALDPEWSYLDFCQRVQRAIEQDASDPLVMGNLGPTFSVVTGLPAISGRYGSLTPEERQRLYRPTHYLSLGELPSEERAPIEKASRVELLGRYDVIDWTGPRGAHLYRLVYQE